MESKVVVPFFLPYGTGGGGMWVRVLDSVGNDAGEVELIAYGMDSTTGSNAGAVVTRRAREVVRRAAMAVTGTLRQTVQGRVDEEGKVVT